MYFQPLDLTTALRPSLLPQESLLFVQNAVGLYEGKFKIAVYQNGQIYLTSHRICYVDNVEPRKSSVAIELREIERYEFYAGFLKSSPKVTLYFKTSKVSVSQNRTVQPIAGVLRSESSPLQDLPASSQPRSFTFVGNSQDATTTRPSLATWICPICSFSNSMPAGFDAAVATPRTPLPSCLSCGIKPPLAHILKAVIAGASGRQPSSLPANRNDAKSHLENGRKPGGNFEILSESALRPNEAHSLSDSKFQCPRCTFENHPSLLECELCGAPLVSRPRSLEGSSDDVDRSDSPGPLLEGIAGNSDNNREGIKLSFRDGGEKVFYERLKGAMTQRKWLLQNAPPIPRPTYSPVPVSSPPDSHSHDVRSERTKVVGIASLERRGQQLRKNNEVVIGSAFEDLAALMASAKEIVALAESFANKPVDKSLEANALLVESATALDMVITRDMLGSGARAQPLYLSELSRNLAEFLTDDAKGILRREGGIMSLVDLWAVFNRARGGVELISPADFEKAARLWETLCLPVRLRQFKNGLLVVQRYDWTDDKTIGQFLSWLQELHEAPSQENVPWDWQTFGCGVTAQATAHRFGWSVGVASEELEMAEERGVLCREDGVEGLRFWKNHILGQGN